MSYPLQRLFAGIMWGFIAYFGLFSVTLAETSGSTQVLPNNLTESLPGPINEAINYLNDLSNKIGEKLPQYKGAIDISTVPQTLSEKSLNYNSLNDIVQGIKNWYDTNVNLANAPGFVDKVVEIFRRIFEFIGEVVKRFVDYL